MRMRSPGTSTVWRRAGTETLECRTLLSASFGTAVAYPGVTAVSGIAAGDLNGDGKADMVVAGLSPVANVPVVGVYLNNGAGGFGVPTLLPFAGSPGGIGLGSFDSGSSTDIAVVDSTDNQLVVFLGDGAGDFTPGAGASLGGSGGDTALAVADFNGDGSDDVAVLDPVDGQVVIATSNGDGSFTAGAAVAVPDPVALVAADFNGDRRPDLAVASGNGQVYVAMNDGAGNFSAPQAFALSSSIPSIASMATADFNGDGVDDLAVLGGPVGAGPSVEVLLNSGSGTFAASTPLLTAQTGATLLTTGDFSQTGNQDIAAIGSDGSLDLFDGDGTGKFTADSGGVIASILGTPVEQAITADFNKDSVPDIACLTGASGGGFDVILNTTGGNSNTGVLLPTISRSSLPTTVVAGSTAHGIATVTVTNTATSTVNAPVIVGVYAASDGMVDSSAILVGAVKRAGIKGHFSVNVAVPIKLPATLPAGQYTLLAEVGDRSGNAAASATGPDVSVAAPLVSFSESLIKTTLAASAVSGQKTRATVELKITNNGNITSTGNSTIAILASPDTAPVDGMLIRSLTQPIVLKPHGSRTVNVALLSLPAIADGNYFLVAEVTDAGSDVTSVASSSTFQLAGPFISLAPVQQTATIANHGNGPASVAFVLSNQGNIASTGLSTFNLYSSADGTLADASLVFTRQITLLVQPGKELTFHVQVPAAQSMMLRAATMVLMQIVDPLGGTQTVVLPF